MIFFKRIGDFYCFFSAHLEVDDVWYEGFFVVVFNMRG